ncbi:MAG: LPS assembly protein LptD [Candidatus Eisenbacteria bacterium]
MRKGIADVLVRLLPLLAFFTLTVLPLSSSGFQPVTAALAGPLAAPIADLPLLSPADPSPAAPEKERSGREESAREQFDISADRLQGSRQGEEEIVVLEGNVRIVHGTTTATADTGFYYKQRERINLAGRVSLREQDVEVRGSRAEYLKLERTVIFPSGVEFLEAASRLTADRGTYDIAADSLNVDGNVTYSEGMRSIAADKITYVRPRGLVSAWGNVVIEDRNAGAVVRAGEATYLRDTGFGMARKNPVLEILAREGRQPLSVSADSMELYADEKKAIALGDVGIVRGKASGHGGRAVFLDLEDQSILTEKPTMVQGESSLSGDSITIYSKDQEISQVVVSGAAKCIYQPDKGERSELAGRGIVLDFGQGEISEMHIIGDASGIFLPSREDTASSRNEVRGSSMVLDFKNGRAISAKVAGGVHGLYTIAAADTGEAVTGLTGQAPRPGAVEGASTGDVVYESDSLRYDVPQALMYLEGKASISYLGMKLYSEAIEYNSRTYNLYAAVDPVLWEGEDKITGSAMSYNLKTKRGAVVAGRTRFEKGLYTGRLIRKTGATTLNVTDGTYTTCNYLDPHYSFTSSRMKLYLDDKVVAKPVVLRVRNVPIFALPFYMFPIKRGRHSGILIPRIELGFDQAKGRFIRNAGYYWAPNDYFDVTAWGDYYEKSRWVGHAETRYNVRYLLGGSFEGSFTRNVEADNSRWDLSGRHSQTVGENGRLAVHADFVSDKGYRRDTSDDLEKALRRVLESDLSYSRSWQGASLNLAAERRQNLDTDETAMKLPTVSFLLTRKTLFAPTEGTGGWHKGTYISTSSNYSSSVNETSTDRKTRQAGSVNVNLDSDLSLKGMSQSVRSRLVLTGERKDMSEWCSGCVGGRNINAAADWKTDLVAKLNPFGFLNLNPSITASATLYNQDKAGKKYPVRLLYWGGFDSRVTLYRTYFPRIGPLAALRHVITPAVGFTHRPDFSRYSGKFYPLAGVSTEVGKSTVMSLALSNRFQAKLGSGADVRKVDDLFSLNTSTTYDFLYKDKGQPTPLSMIRSNLRFYPSRYATFDVDVSHEPVHLSLKSLDLQTTFSYDGKTPLPPGFIEPPPPDEPRVLEEGVGAPDPSSPTAGPWRVNVAYRYTKAFDGGKDSYWIEFMTGFCLTRNWRIEYSGRFDLSGKQTVYQEYSIYRDLHCWEARFVRRYSDGDWEYYFRLNIKAHPDIYAERGLRALYRAY